MIDKRAQEFLDSRSPLEREALLAPYRDFVEEITWLGGVFDVESHQRAVARIERSCIARWAEDFMAKSHASQGPLGIFLTAEQKAEPEGRVEEIWGKLPVRKDDAHDSAPKREETWRDRPPLL